MESGLFNKSSGPSTFKAQHGNHNRGRFHPYRSRGSSENGRGGRGRWNGNRGGFRGKRNFQGRPGGGKSWVNDNLRRILQERDQLYQKAMETQDPEDWKKYNNAETAASELMTSEVVLAAPVERKSSGALFSCDTCDRSFPTVEAQEEHFAEHVTCNLDGCTFTAHPKILLKHIEMQHSNNLFKRINTAKDPEDIKKWVEERKANYPTVQNRERKAQEMEERYNRGERIPMSYMRKRQYDQSLAKKEEERGNKSSTNEQSNTEIDSSSTSESKISEDKLKLEGLFKQERKVMEPKERHQREPRPKKVRQPFLYSDEKQKQLSKEDAPEILTLDNFYSKVRVVGKTKLLGTNMLSWNATTLKVSNEIASTGLGMRYLMSNMNIHLDSEDENVDGIADPAITDDEDDWGLSGDDSKDYVAAPDAKASVNTNKTTSASTPVGSALGLVAYSDDSDSEGEAPEELSTCKQVEPAESKLSSAPELDIDSKVSASIDYVAVPKHPESLSSQSLSSDPASKQVARTEDEPKRNKTAKASKNAQKQKKAPAAKRRPRMSKFLNKLLGDDIRRERNQILQVCRYICENNFFEESKPKPYDDANEGTDIINADPIVSFLPNNLDEKLSLPESAGVDVSASSNQWDSQANPVCELASIIMSDSMREVSTTIEMGDISKCTENSETQISAV